MQGENPKILTSQEQSIGQYKNPFDTSIIKFKRSFTSRLGRTEINSKIQQFINQEEWDFPQQFDYLLAILPHIEEANCRQISSISLSQPFFLSYITSISFPQLLNLNLSCEYLTSTQPIFFLNSPQLKYLNFSCNLFIHFKPFVKMNFPNLQSLEIEENKFTHIELGKVRLNPSIQFFISIFEVTDVSELAKGNLPFFYDIKSLYMKLEATNFTNSMLHQFFLFKEDAQVFSSQLKLKLSEKVAHKFKFKNMTSLQILKQLQRL